jgi:hypothetical protein
MRPAKAKFKKFKQNPKYVHMRSEGLTRRQNGGTRRLVLEPTEEEKEQPTSESLDPT